MLLGISLREFVNSYERTKHIRRQFALGILFSIAALCTTIIQSAPALAQAVTWTQTDIGAVGITGTYSYTPGTPPTFTIGGAGAGLGLFDDVLTYVHTDSIGNCEISGEVFSQTNTGSNAMAGFCFRDSLQTERSASYSIYVTPSNGINFQYRDHFGGAVTITGPAVAAPVYLKLARTGTASSGFTTTGYYSTDGGLNWTSVGSRLEPNTNPMSNKFMAGFIVSSTIAGTLSTAVFKSVSFCVNVPQQSSNLLLWLRSDSGITASGGAVSGWSDSSGNGNDAAQSTGSAKPSLVTGSVNSGVLPSLAFDGTASYMNLPTDFSNLTSGASIFVVLNPSSGSATGTPFTCGNTSNNDALICRTVGQNAALYTFNGGTSSNVTTSTTPLTVGSYQVLELLYEPGASAGTGTIWVNGAQEAQATNLVQTLTNTSRSSNFIGVGSGLANFFPGSLCEILVFNTRVSESSRRALNTYFRSKYGLGAQETLDTPVITPSSGVYLPQQGTVISQNQNGVVYYSLDGSSPSTSSLYFYNNLPFFLQSVSPQYVPKVSKTSTVKAIAKAPFWNDSAVASANYQMDQSTAAIPRNGLIQWLRGSDVTTSGSNVTVWQDISGSLNDASNGSNQPTLVSSAVNGLPAVNFSGSQFLSVPPGMANFASGMTAMLVAKPSSVSAGARLFDYGNGASSDNVIMSLPSSTGLTFSTFNTSTSSSATASTGVTLGNFQLLESVYNGSNSANLFVNGAAVANSTSMQTLNNLTRNLNNIGQDNTGSNRFNGQLAELMIWNRALSSAERTAVEGALLSKYQMLSTNVVAIPTFTIASGTTFGEPSQVAIGAVDGAKIFLTRDGSTPSTSSEEYVQPLFITHSQTVKAIAVLNGVSSSVATANYSLDSTRWPSPSNIDSRQLDIKQQLPNTGIPHDTAQP